MSYSTITNNILKPFVSLSSDNPVVHVLYEKSGSILDQAISYCDNISTIFNQQNIDFLSNDIYFTTNPIAYSSYVGHIKQKHMHDLVYFLHKSPNDIKKEDKFLVQDKLSKSKKIVKDNAIKNDWHIKDNASVLDIGIPIVNSNNVRNKSLMVLNTHNNRTIDAIYKDLKQYLPDAGILSNITNLSYPEISSILQEYCICLELQDNYNIGVAVANGCRVITNRNSEFNDYVFISEFNDINLLKEDIKNQLKNFENYDNKNAIKDIDIKYNFDTFNKKIYAMILDIMREPVLL